MCALYHPLFLGTWGKEEKIAGHGAFGFGAKRAGSFSIEECIFPEMTDRNIEQLHKNIDGYFKSLDKKTRHFLDHTQKRSRIHLGCSSLNKLGFP